MSSDMSGTFALKAALRKSLLRTLKQLSDVEIEEQSRAVASRLFKLPLYREAKRVGCYLSMGSGELRTHAIVDDLLERGVELYTPILAGTTMRMLRLYSPADLVASPVDKWGIVDPGDRRRDVDEQRADAMDVDLDLVLIPGVAFDERCERLGRGKAYYDRYLAEYTAKRKSPLLLALGLRCQLVEAVPTTPGDFQLDGVITPDKTISRA